jgi:hypothetical protein
MYSIQHYVIKFVGDLWQVGGFLWVLRFPPPIKLKKAVCCGSLLQSEILEGKKAVCCGILLQSDILEGKRFSSLSSFYACFCDYLKGGSSLSFFRNTHQAIFSFAIFYINHQKSQASKPFFNTELAS